MVKIGRALGIIFLIPLCAPAMAANAPIGSSCFGSGTLRSPDGAWTAQIDRQGGTGCGESKVVIADRRGRLVARRDFTSSDGQHGEGVERAAWSPDGRYFAFTLSSSGGHQPDHFPMLLFRRSDRTFTNVETADPSIRISSPDFSFAPNGVAVKDRDGAAITVPFGSLGRGAPWRRPS